MLSRQVKCATLSTNVLIGRRRPGRLLDRRRVQRHDDASIDDAPSSSCTRASLVSLIPNASCAHPHCRTRFETAQYARVLVQADTIS